jgi:hypothetical protein
MDRIAFGVASAGVAAVVGSAGAGTTVYSTGFERPVFVLGDLHGQDNWESEFVVDPANANIQSDVVRSGDQALEIATGNQQGSNFWFRQGSNFNVLDGDENVVDVTYQTLLGQSQDASDVWGLQIYDTSLNLVAYAFINENNNVAYLDGVTGQEVVSGTTVGRGVWFGFGLSLDYVTRTYSVLINGDAVLSGLAFTDEATSFFGDASLWLAGPGDDVAYFDDFDITRTPAPGGVALGLVAIAVGGRRRR